MARLALIQTCAGDDLQVNLQFALKQVEAAARAGAAVAALPEVFLYIGGKKGKFAAAQSMEGRVVEQFREAARRHGMAILLGSLLEPIPGREDKLYNTSVWIDEAGEVAALYRKIKLFDVDLPTVSVKESDTTAPGDQPSPVFQTPIGKVGLTICFELRYPELFQQLRRKGAEVVFVPANFTASTGAAHWEALLRARAVENQLYIAAPAQYGRHKNSQFTSFGHTALVDPWGTITTMAPEQLGLVIGEIDLEYLHKVRRELPMGLPS